MQIMCIILAYNAWQLSPIWKSENRIRILVKCLVGFDCGTFIWGMKNLLLYLGIYALFMSSKHSLFNLQNKDVCYFHDIVPFCQKLLPAKSDVFDADSESDGDKDLPLEVPTKKKKKIKDEDSSPKEKKRKKKDKLRDDTRPLPGPDTDEDEDEEKGHTPSSPIKDKRIESRKQLVDSDDDEDDAVPSKKHKKVKAKDGGRHKKGEEGKKKRGKRERKIETSEDEAAAPLEEELSDGLSESQMDTSASTDTTANSIEKTQLEKHKQKKGKCEVKLQGIQDLIQDKKKKKSDSLLKESSLQKLKSLTSKNKDEAAPHSDSSDSSTLHKKSKSKGQESVSTSSKAPSSTTSSSSSSSSAAAGTTKGKEEELIKEEILGQKDAPGSTNLFEKFLLNCEAKDRVPRRQPAHQSPAEKSGSKPAKVPSYCFFWCGI